VGASVCVSAAPPTSPPAFTPGTVRVRLIGGVVGVPGPLTLRLRLEFDASEGGVECAAFGGRLTAALGNASLLSLQLHRE
jgi:hypothetical protein